MKKTPPSSSTTEQLGGSSHFLGNPVMSGNQDIWIDRGSAPEDSNVLVTLSGPDGEKTVLVTSGQIIDSSAKLFVTTPPERIVTKRDLQIVKAKRALSLLGYAFAALMITFSALSASGVMKARVVLTNSMEPTISPGDIVLTMSPERIEPAVGKVAAYQARRFDGSPVGVFSHRIIAGDAEQGWVLKGDNNPDPDTQKPKNDDILGVVFFVIPFIGNFLTKQAIIIMAPIGVAIWMAIDTLRGSDEE
jgi:signal peptidase I